VHFNFPQGAQMYRQAHRGQPGNRLPLEIFENSLKAPNTCLVLR